MGPVADSYLLAVDPTSRGFAWGYLRGAHALLGSGTVRVPTLTNGACLSRFELLLDRLTPDVVVLEEPERSRRCPRVVDLIRQMEVRARRRTVPVRRISRGEVEAAFGTRTKHAVACELAESFPRLRRKLPRRRKPWESEDERMNLFDAVSFAVTYALSAPLPVIHA